jgi:hypothetical protein
MKVNWSQKALENRRNKYTNDPEYRSYTLRYNALRRYKITPEQYDAQLEKQGGHCALCDYVSINANLHVDHNHECCSKKFHCGKCNRGLLCSKCNVRLGFFELFLKDALVLPFLGASQSWTAKALRYLTQYSTQEKK